MSNRETVRESLRRLGRTANDAELERLAGIFTKLLSCQMTATAEMGFKLTLQTWRNTGLTDERAREVALTQRAIMIAEGELQIADNLLVVTEKGRQWLERQSSEGHGRGNRPTNDLAECSPSCARRADVVVGANHFHD